MEKRDGREIAKQNELEVLRALHRFGWLRTRDIALLVWSEKPVSRPTGEPKLNPIMPGPSAIRMAQRTMVRLKAKKLVLEATAPNRSIIYALSEGGARILQSLGLPAETGKDLVRKFSASHFRHRCIANEIAISALCDGYRVATERETAKGRWFGGVDGVFGKIPDVIVRHGEKVWWVEVERSRKNVTEYARLLDWLIKAWKPVLRPGEPAPLDEKHKLARVIFVCTDAFANRLSSDLLSAGWTPRELVCRVLFSQSLYSMEAIEFL